LFHYFPPLGSVSRLPEFAIALNIPTIQDSIHCGKASDPRHISLSRSCNLVQLNLAGVGGIKVPVRANCEQNELAPRLPGGLDGVGFRRIPQGVERRPHHPM
jgi:hypothetical protein